MLFSTPEHDAHDTDTEVRDRANTAQKTTWVSIVVNLVLSILQVVVGWFARSQALIADGMHSLSDLLADFIVLFASRKSQKAADADHPYGYQRYETAASLALGGLLLVVGLGMLWAAFVKLQSPKDIAEVHVIALWIALLTLLAKELLFRYMLSAAKRVKSSMLIANAWHARSDAASSLVVACGIIGNLSGLPLLDPVAALVVGVMVCRTGWNFSADALRDLMDHAADSAEVAAIEETLKNTPGVLGVHDLKTRKMGDMIVVEAHLEVNAMQTVEAGHNIAVEARRRVLSHHRVLNLSTHIDPANQPDQDHLPPTAIQK